MNDTAGRPFTAKINGKTVKGQLMDLNFKAWDEESVREWVETTKPLGDGFPVSIPCSHLTSRAGFL
jgi:hypothetical protein